MLTWAIIEPLLIKFTVEEIVNILVKAGVLSQLQGSFIKTAEDLEFHLQNIQFVYSYPNDPPGATNQSNITIGVKTS